MFRPILLFLTGKTRQQLMDCHYGPVATEEEPIPAHLHPLLISHVVAKISSHLSVNDLLNFRLVCNSWHGETVKLLQGKIKYVKVHPRKMNEFLRIFRRSYSVPAVGFSFYIDHSEHLYSLKSITENLADTISCLRLSISSQEIPNLSKMLHNLYLLRDLVLLRIPEKNLPPPYRKYEILEEDLSLPNLTSISFQNTHPTMPFICNYDNFVIEIINSAPNLTSLEFQNWKSSLQQILRFTDIQPSLHTLSLRGSPVKESEIAALIKKNNMGLKTLKINVGKNIRYETLTLFFQKLENSLENLDIICDVVSSTFPVHCDLPHLKTLKFQNWKCQITLDNFLLKFPMLHTITLLDVHFIGFTDYYHKDRRKTGGNGTSLVDTVRVRPCLENEYLALAELNVASLITAFPNVRKFTGFFISDAMCQLIFKYWPQLEYLRIETCGDLSDFGITGILPHFLDKNACHHSKCPLNQNQNQNPISPERINNHLGNLTRLKYLYLEGNYNGLLTNVSLVYGILNLPNLQELYIPDDACQWCFDCMGSQLKRLKILHVSPNSEQINAQNLHFLKKRIESLIVLPRANKKKRHDKSIAS